MLFTSNAVLFWNFKQREIGSFFSLVSMYNVTDKFEHIKAHMPLDLGLHINQESRNFWFFARINYDRCGQSLLSSSGIFSLDNDLHAPGYILF